VTKTQYEVFCIIFCQKFWADYEAYQQPLSGSDEVSGGSWQIVNAICDEGRQKKVRRPKPWKHTEVITKGQLKQMRDEFWDTAPHYGGQKEIWDALRAAAEADIHLAQAIVDSAGIIVQSEDLSTCYDERGAKYDLPKYVLSEPMNIKED
jgi:hypothetical protein